MSKKIISIVLAMIMLVGCFALPTQARDAGIGTGAESFNPVKFYVDKETLIGANINTKVNVEIVDKNYQIRLNSVEAYIPYYTEGGISYLDVAYTKGMIVSGAEALTVTGTLTANVNSVVRYTFNYDILDKKNNTVWKNLTGYTYAFVSSNESKTGAVGSYHAYPGNLSDGCYFEVLETLNTTYVQQAELQLLYKVRTQSAWNYRDPRTRGVGVISGNQPSTLTMMPDNNGTNIEGTMNWPKCGAVYRSDSADWLRMTEPESGYYNFTVSFNTWNDEWEDQSNITETTEMYYIRSSDKVDAYNTANKYIKSNTAFADGYYVQKGRYTEDSWNAFVNALDVAYQVALSVPNANYGYKLACVNAQSANEALDAAFANLKEAEHDFYAHKDPAVTPATCTEEGSELLTCICGETKINILPATGHTRGAWNVVKQATCNEEGKEEIRCTVCNEIVEEKVTPKIAHIFETTVTEPDCTNQGYTTYVCTVCGYTYTSDYVAPNGHDYNYVKIDPTCTEQGYTLCACKNCDYRTTNNYTSATGHTYDAVVTEPACTEQGYTTYTCTVCSDSYVADYTTPAGHTSAEAVEENRIEADCENAGSYDMVVYCSVCNEELSRETFAIDALGHSEGDAVEENRVEPTMTEKGSYDKVVYCTVCNEELSRETIVIPMTGGYFREAEGSTTVINKDLGFIYGLDIGLADIEEYVEYATNVSYELSSGVGTGSAVTTYLNGEEWETYIIIIFGDLNSDGVIDIYDASILAAIVNGDMEVEEDSAIAFASDLNGDTAIDIYDLAILNAVVNGETEISQVPIM
ncbi:MAG: hypothetical protein E7536_04940 [Ruminococcaceae bacterium]|nr:hypothetical protein [Oscillospiraceae bacterium]